GRRRLGDRGRGGRLLALAGGREVGAAGVARRLGALPVGDRGEGDRAGGAGGQVEVVRELVVLGREEVLVRLELGHLAVELVGDVDGRLVVLLPGGHRVADPDLSLEAAGGDGDVGVPGERRRGQDRGQEQGSQADGGGRTEAEAGSHCCRAPFACSREKRQPSATGDGPGACRVPAERESGGGR